MSLIKNLIKEPEKKQYKPKSSNNSEDNDDTETEQKSRPIIKSTSNLQRLKLEKLMKNPDKPVIIPEPRREKDYMSSVPTFVRNVMGSSAGAGSGEFHVYRHLRRKEYARQKTIQALSLREQKDIEYQEKLEQNRRTAEEKTAKKRAKRLKKKQRAKRAKANPATEKKNADIPSNDESNDDDDDDEDDNGEGVEKAKQDNTETGNDNAREPLPANDDDKADLPPDDKPKEGDDKKNTEIPATEDVNDDEGDVS